MADEANSEKTVLVEQLCHASNNEVMDTELDTELQLTQQHTVNIFCQYVQQTCIPSVVGTQCTGHSTACTPVRSKSRETHPSLVHSTCVRGEKRSDSPPVSTHGVQTEETDIPLATSTPAASLTVSDDKDYLQADACHNSTSASSSCRSSTPRNNDVNTTDGSGTRPRSLFLDVKRPNYKRGISNVSSGSSGKTTPAQDPPLFSPTSDLVQSYPPTTGQWIHANKATTTTTSKSTVVEVEARHPNAARLNTKPLQCRGDPQKVLARKIADRLKFIGDQLEESEQMEGLLEQIQHIFSQSLTTSMFSWRRVQEIFSVLSHLLKQLVSSSQTGIPDGDERWTKFQKLWDLLIHHVTPWITRSGGWAAFLRSTECIRTSHHHHHHGTGDRHSLCLSEVVSSPLLPQCQIQTVTPPTSEVWTHTPKLSRARRSNQTAPALSRSSTLPEFGRSRVWSWSEKGNMERELHPSESCAEFEEDDDDSPLIEPGEVFSSDDVDPEVSNVQVITSSPFIVNSPHRSNSQTETNDYHVDSGIHSSIETLSLSLSPPHVQFGIGEVSAVQLHHHTASSCTSLGSYSSLDPDSVDSSRKNSITSQSGRRSSTSKPHPHRAGHNTKRHDDERTPTRPHSAGFSYQGGASSYSGSEFMYSVGIGLSAAYVFHQVRSLLNK